MQVRIITILAFGDELYQTYEEADPHLHESLVYLFFDIFIIRDCKIVKGMLEKRAIIIRNDWLPSSNTIITLMMDNSFWKNVAKKLRIIAEVMKTQDGTLLHVSCNFSALPL